MRSPPLPKSSPDFLLRLCLLSAAVLLPGTLAYAADYEPPLVIDQAPEYTPVEVGSGWYLRGDVGGAVNAFEHSEEDDFEADKRPFVGSIGIGYHWTDYLRTELNLGILPSDKFSTESDTTCLGQEVLTVTPLGTSIPLTGTREGSRPCQAKNEGSNRSYSLFADAYFDLGTVAGITPYIGGGVGAVYTKMRAAAGAKECKDSTSTTSTATATSTLDFNCYDKEYYEGDVNSEGQYNFAYNLGAGLSYRLTTNGSIDLGYQYINVPDAKTVSYENGGFVYDEGIDVHSVKVGFRYDVW